MFQFELVTILLIESDFVQARLIEKNLQAANVTNPLFLVREGLEALDYLLSKGSYQGHKLPSPLMVILDLDMADGSAVRVLTAINADVNLRKLPVMLLTTSDSQAEVAKAMELGFERFIKKPVNNEKIAAAVNAAGYFFSIVAMHKKRES